MPQSSIKFSCCLNRARRSGESRGTSAKLFTSLNSIRKRNRASVVFKIIETSSQLKTLGAGTKVLRPGDGCLQIAVIDETPAGSTNGCDSTACLTHLVEATNLTHNR